jgi:tripartite-type tricarboxylate transporter receptor subunit TctC
VKDGRLKLLASTGPKRFPSTPDVPTLAESGLKDFEATSWIGLLAPAGTPPHVIGRYNEEMVRILNSPDIQKRLHEMEFEIVASSPKQFSDWIGSEIVRWGKVIKDTGAKAE